MTPQFLNKKYSSLKEFHHYLKDNMEHILAEKKSTIYKSIEKGGGIGFIDFSNVTGVVDKSIIEKANAYGFKKGFIYPVVNSTNWLDSHFDVHLKGCYKKTVKEQQGKVYLIDTHQKGLANILAKKQDVRMLIKDIDWRLLGKDIDGETESLVFEIAEHKVRPDALGFIKETPDLENSFAMRYINCQFAIKSNDPAFKEENEVFEEYIGHIANPEMAKKYGFFNAVKELAIMGEGSICPVVGGSNSATRVLNIAEPSNHSDKHTEPSEEDTQKESLKKFVSLIKI